MLNKRIVLKHDEYAFVEDQLDAVLEPCQVYVKINCCVLRVPNSLARQFVKKTPKSDAPFGREISGTVEAVGDRVTLCKPGDEVVGIIPLDSDFSGCGMYCVLTEYDVVLKPDIVTHLNAACAIGDALKAYTALFYQAKVVSGETIAIASAAKGLGILATQLAMECGLKVIVIGSTDEEIAFLHALDPPANQVVDLRNKKHGLVTTCLQETGGLGVDCFLDDGVDMRHGKDIADDTSEKLSKYEVISSLGVGGRWITTANDLQLDPADSMLLSMKCSSVHFLFEDSWTLSRGAQGKYLHILNDVMHKLSAQVLRPTVHHTVVFNDCLDILGNLDEQSTIGRILVKM